jgi:DNA helicase II / ATP-dependent DNA helicase PcrA
MTWNEGLTGTALQIAATTETPLRVMAGPGTGKSFAMKRRVARLLEENVHPRRILAVTFTRNAAASVVDDLNALGVEGCDQIHAGTLHAYCFGLLGQQEVFDFLGRVARPVITFSKSGVLQFEGGAMLDDLISEGDFGGKRECTKRIRAFEAAWARLQSEEPGWPNDATDKQFQAALLSWLVFHKAILIGELVPEALRFLKNNPACAARTAFDHVIVDEYQDLNRAEQDLIDLLAENGTTAIVGDIDQSIYRFRHANPEGIESFNTTHDNTHDESLDECRRCPTRVVAIADHLIRHNHPALPDARLRPKADNPLGRVHSVQWQTIQEEAQGLCDYVRDLIANRGYLPSDILILTPRRLLGYGIRDCIAGAGIAVHSFYHEEALESEDAQRAFALLSLLADNEDRVALRWWLGHDSPSARREAYRKVRQHCEATGISPWAALTALASGALVLPGVTPLVNNFRELVATLQNLQTQTLPTIVDNIMPDGVEGSSVLRGAALLALPECENVQELLDAVQTCVTQPEIPEDVDFVRIMSLQKSKGLTSKVAIVAGCIQGLIPFQDFKKPHAEQQAILAEQRRLFYVAITRCTEILVLSSARTLERKLAFKLGAKVSGGYGAVGTTVSSQFFGELGPQAPQPEVGANWAAGNYGF